MVAVRRGGGTLRTGPVRWLIASVALVVGIALTGGDARTANGAPASGFVERNGSQFTLDGAPFRFIGVNVYDLAGDPRIFHCRLWKDEPEVELDAWLGRIRTETGARVIRFWAFQTYTAGGEDWSALDRAVRLATKHDLKLIPVLENQWSHCANGPDKLDSWYAGGYQHPYGNAPISYKEYVRRVVGRYRDEPAIAAWMLMNEAESQTAAGVAAPEPLYAFARDMSAYVKSIDPNHLVTLGVGGGGQLGAAGTDYERLHALPTIDFATFHDYRNDDDPLPGGPLVLAAELTTELYTLDNAWTWRAQGFRRNKARTWETWTGTLPAGAQPLQRIGLSFSGSYAGTVYVDEVRIGSRAYHFEHGHTQGWQTNGPVTLSTENVEGGPGHSLKVTLIEPGSGRQIWIPVPEDASPGAPISVRVMVDTGGVIDPYTDTLATAIGRARRLDKPVVVGESGMSTCVELPYSTRQSPASRAAKFDAKIDAFFKHGGAGYLVWSWHPTDSCSFNFSSGDPLNGVLTRRSAAIR